jgi:alkaline phosphatase D
MLSAGRCVGDPTADGMILWTRRPPVNGTSASRLTVEIATDEDFRHVVSRTHARMSAATDWTCRVLVAGLAPAREYWYRFADDHGMGAASAERSRRRRPRTTARCSSRS